MTDELMQLWQQGASNEPDPREIARLAARATTIRFDKLVFWRNFREYAAGFAVMAVYGWLAIHGKHPVENSITVAAVGFVMVYLWWQHRGLKPLDPAADARTYQTAMLARVDRQIRLLRSVRYWYLAPLFVGPLMQAVELARKGQWSRAAIGLLVVTLVFWGIAVLNERVAAPKLIEQRRRIEALYEEDL